MKHFSKLFAMALAICIMVVLAAGCHSNMSYTFTVENGDDIKVTLDTSNGNKLGQQDGVFYIENDDEMLSQGLFMLEDDYKSYFAEVPGSEGVKVIDEGTVDGNKFIFYEYDDGDTVTYYHIIAISGSSTGIGLVNTISQESAEQCFELLSFSVE